MSNKEILFIGHSHTQAIYEASVHIKNVIEWGFLDPINGVGPVEYRDEKYYLIPSIQKKIALKAKVSSKIISTIAGNAHNYYGLIENNVPFDFESPEIIRREYFASQRIPYQIIKNSLKRKLYKGDITMLQAALNEGLKIESHIESPPPIKDNNIILKFLDNHFLINYPQAKISNPWFRLSFWKLHSQIFKEFCNENNITYIHAPSEALDNDGFLNIEYLSAKSSTHANMKYGLLVLKQLNMHK